MSIYFSTKKVVTPFINIKKKQGRDVNNPAGMVLHSMPHDSIP
jgi:hypothetical protein